MKTDELIEGKNKIVMIDPENEPEGVEIPDGVKCINESESPWSIKL